MKIGTSRLRGDKPADKPPGLLTGDEQFAKLRPVADTARAVWADG